MVRSIVDTGRQYSENIWKIIREITDERQTFARDLGLVFFFCELVVILKK